MSVQANDRIGRCDGIDGDAVRLIEEGAVGACGKGGEGIGGEVEVVGVLADIRPSGKEELAGLDVFVIGVADNVEDGTSGGDDGGIGGSGEELADHDVAVAGFVTEVAVGRLGQGSVGHGDVAVGEDVDGLAGAVGRNVAGGGLGEGSGGGHRDVPHGTGEGGVEGLVPYPGVEEDVVVGEDAGVVSVAFVDGEVAGCDIDHEVADGDKVALGGFGFVGEGRAVISNTVGGDVGDGVDG